MSQFITPPFLKHGDKIGIVSPAGRIEKKSIDNAVDIFKSWGLDVIIGKHALNIKNQFAGTDDERAADFQAMLDDESIKAIICSRGGYGSIRIINKLDFTNFLKNPKWVVGYSDITVFHTFLSNHHIKSIHGPMPKSFPTNDPDDESINSLQDALFGKSISFRLTSHIFNKEGNIRAQLKGGNLSIIHSLHATPFELDTQSSILFIEDIGEHHYKIDRMLENLQLSGKLEKLKGIIAGQFTNIKDTPADFGQTVYEIIEDKTKNYNYPVIFNLQAGHERPNHALILGNEIELSANSDEVLIDFL